MSTDPSHTESDFFCWPEGYSGLLHDDRHSTARSLVFGWDSGRRAVEIDLEPHGAVWGFVQRGEVAISQARGQERIARTAEFIVTGNGATASLAPGTRLFAVQQIGFRALPMHGGPIESLGRLRYIDGCSDSLLLAPLLAGDPCLNHLHFPPATTQTHHTHPSLRAGVVVRGEGSCTTPSGEVSLVPGLIFVIPVDGVHGFHTADDSMDVIAYHPDSNVGPRHEDHPMINRTLVNGRKIDNTRGRHLGAQVSEGRFAVGVAVGADAQPEE